MSINTVAIVVLYNPNLKKLQHLFESIYFQINAIVFVDNSPTLQIQIDNNNWLKNLNQSNCHYISLGDNLGIASAQNVGIQYAKKQNADYILFMDQDSELPEGMVQGLVTTHRELEGQGQLVATIGPIFIDEKTNEIAPIIRHKGLKVCRDLPDTTRDYEIVDYIISSGSLVHIKTLDKVGNMADELFIDFVDLEWCIRAKQFGFVSYVNPKIVMKHCIGDESTKLASRSVNLHSDFRNYFIVRNSLYLALYSKLPMNFRIIQLFKTPLYVLFYSYHSKKPFYSLKLLLIAVKDAIFKKMGKGYFSEKEI